MKKTALFKFLALISIMAFIALGFGTTAFAKQLKVGFVYVSPVGDAGWTYQHDQGRLEMEKNLGSLVTSKYIENVPEGAEVERVIRNLAQTGHGLIFTTSFGYMNPTLKVAKSFPNVIFEHSTGYKRADNVGTYMCRFYEGRYLTGIVAGVMTKSNQLGYVAAFPIPEVIRGINAFTLGAKSVNPNVKVKVIWVNSWFDPGKEREASEALIDQGVDVLTHHTDSTAAVLTAEDKGIWSIAYHSDMSKYGPKSQLTATMHIWGDYYTQEARKVLDGTWKSEAVWGGIAQNMIDIAPLNEAVPENVVTMINGMKQNIKDGVFHPFTGPIKKQDGTIAIEEGRFATDDELLGMDYYVQGILGSIPK